MIYTNSLHYQALQWLNLPTDNTKLFCAATIGTTQKKLGSRHGEIASLFARLIKLTVKDPRIPYPVKLAVIPSFRDELEQCEEGRYEDAFDARYRWDFDSIEGNEYEVVLNDFIGRYTTLIKIENDAEMVELYYALASGTIGIHRCTSANNMLDKIREYVLLIAPMTVEKWPCQTGR